jgi:hypothetical protein
MNKEDNPSKIIKTNSNGITELKTIFWWDHVEGEKEHCLLRLFLWDDDSKVIVVCANLKSNLRGFGVIYSFKEISEAILKQFQHLIKVPIDTIEWFIHYGGFSIHEGAKGDVLSKVDPTKESIEREIPKTTIIYKANFKEALGGIELGKIRPILTALDWELEDWSSDADYE